jgi:hypothetical protein
MAESGYKIDPDQAHILTINPGDIFHNVINVVLFACGAAAVLVIVLAGFMFVTSGGDASAIAKAKSAILYAVIGIVVVMLAFTITQFVIGGFS